MYYQLEDYRSVSESKHICPECKKRTFVRYAHIITGEYLADHVGKCDRRTKSNGEDTCNYHYTPKMYFENSDVIRRIEPVEHKAEKPRPIDYIPQSVFLSSKSYNSTLFAFLYHRFGEDVKRVFDMYQLGASKQQEVVFWQVDDVGRCRAGKVMLYNPNTGKRIRGERDRIDWAHTRMKLKSQDGGKFNMNQCLFGLHLVKEYPDKPIVVVESEKTALIGSIVEPGFIWLSVGGKQNFGANMLCAIKDKRITAIPDADGITEWSDTANDLNRRGYNINISNIYTTEQLRTKIDFADIILNQI